MFAPNAQEPSRPKITLEQFCYDMAYFLISQFAFRGADALRAIIHSNLPQKGRHFYELACKFRGVAPNAELAQQFVWRDDTIRDEAECYARQYPPLPVVDLRRKSFEENLGDNQQFVLAPYFSAFVHDCGDESKLEYYVLGQAFDGGATLRCVTADGQNLRLGSVDQPTRQSLYHELGNARDRMKQRGR